MPLRDRNGKWHYRFKLDGKEYAGSTGLAATQPNRREAQQIEAERLQALKEGRRSFRRIRVREFSDAAEDFLTWANVEYREHSNSYKRIATSFASLTEFFSREPVTVVDEGRIEAYKVWRISEHEVRDVTLRHDLHALSTFFRYAIKQHWCRDNPVRNVSIPSDADAVRIHVLNATEEKTYFARAATHKDLCDAGRLILNQGMRPEEVTSLLKDDIDLDRGQLRVRHGKSPAARRLLDLTTESRQILARRMNGPSPWIFPSPRNPGRPLFRLNSAHDRLCAAARVSGILFDFVLYDLRHTFATRMAQAGIDLASLAALLGHNSLRSVQKYIHPTAEHKRNAMLRYEEAMKSAETKSHEPNTSVN
jgi:site-specific recombinase XerD